MVYLIRNEDNTLCLIDHISRNGLCYRIFTENPNPRTISIANNSLDEYTATIDEQQNIHVIYKNTKQQIIHIKSLFSNIQEDIILDDRKKQYQICNLYACFVKNELHLFYNALHPKTNKSELIHHCISSSHQSVPHALGTVPILGTSYSCYVHQNKIYILSIFKKEQQYFLQLHIYDSSIQEWQPPKILIQSSFPLIHCHLLHHPSGSIYILYVQEKYGQYQLYSLQNQNTHTQLLYSCAYAIKPFFIYYREGLWVHWLEQNTCKMILFFNEGKAFSTPQKTSLQDSSFTLFHYIHPLQHLKKWLRCNEVYGVFSPHPICCILAQLDMDHLHPYIAPNKELKLYLSQYTFTNNPKANLENEEFKNIKDENEQLKEMQENITKQYNELYHFAKQLQQEGRKWRDRYYASQQTQQMELRKEKIQENKKNKTEKIKEK